MLQVEASDIAEHVKLSVALQLSHAGPLVCISAVLLLIQPHAYVPTKAVGGGPSP